MIDKDGRIITQIARVGVAVSMIVVLASLDTSHVVGTPGPGRTIPRLGEKGIGVLDRGLPGRKVPFGHTSALSRSVGAESPAGP